MKSARAIKGLLTGAVLSLLTATPAAAAPQSNLRGVNCRRES